MDFMNRFEPLFLSLLRVMSGLLILQGGLSKHFGFPVGPLNATALQSMPGAAGVFEIVGGLLLIVGLFTRPVAFILSGLYAVAYFYAHANRNFFPLLNGGSLAILLSFAFLYLSAAGGGPFGLDRLIRQKD